MIPPLCVLVNFPSELNLNVVAKIVQLFILESSKKISDIFYRITHLLIVEAEKKEKRSKFQ